MSVECAFQGSKVFTRGGPFTDLYVATSKKAKSDERIKNSGPLIGFNFLGIDFPIEPKTAFYDWLYLLAMSQNPSLCQGLEKFRAFSDIAFNPKKSINCQAHSAALFVALKSKGLLKRVTDDTNFYMRLVTGSIPGTQSEQPELPL